MTETATEHKTGATATEAKNLSGKLYSECLSIQKRQSLHLVQQGCKTPDEHLLSIPPTTNNNSSSQGLIIDYDHDFRINEDDIKDDKLLEL